MVRRAAYSFLLGFGIFLLGLALRTILDKMDVSGVTAIMDDVITGIVAGLMVFAYERHQHKLMLDRMRIIAEMNHHVRNALQPMLYSPFLKEQAEQMRIIQEGTHRIEWALREVLPGEAEPDSANSKSRSAA